MCSVDLFLILIACFQILARVRPDQKLSVQVYDWSALCEQNSMSTMLRYTRPYKLLRSGSHLIFLLLGMLTVVPWLQPVDSSIFSCIKNSETR